jgi:hypothetical protein
MLNKKLIIVIITLSLISCQSQLTKPNIEISFDTQTQLNDLLFPVDYGRLINLSLERDKKSLVKLIRLGKYTNGGGAYGFGIMLQTIALEIGDSAFAEAIITLSSQELKTLHQLLLAGFDYGDSRYNIDDFQVILPKTYQITHPK